jgi:FkbM family methyltransferase
MSIVADRTGLERALIGLSVALVATIAWLLARPAGEVEPAACGDCAKPESQVVVYKPRHAVDFTIDFFGLRYTGNSRGILDLHVMMYGAWEKPLLFFLRDVAAALDEDDLCFVDVGANTGQHSLFMSLHAAEVHAIEPWGRVLEQLYRHIELNQIENIVVHTVGLGAEAGELEFFEPPEGNLGIGSFSEGFSEANQPSQRKLSIVTGDSLVESGRIRRIDLMKMDIESYEKPALAGLRATLERDRPVVVVEITHKDHLDVTFKSTDEILAAFPDDYVLFWFAPVRGELINGAYRLVPYRFEASKRPNDNVVAVPREKIAGLGLQAKGLVGP